MGETKRRMIKGMMWVAIDKYSVLSINIIVSMVLARLLDPSDFGIVTLASICLAFISMLSGMGLGPAIIQQKDMTQKDIDSTFTFTILIGAFFSLVYFGLSWPIAHFYHNEQLVPICQLLSLTFFLGTINSLPETLMVKHQKFKENAIKSLLLVIITGPISIIAACNGMGVYSLMISPFVYAIGVFLYNRRYFPCNIDFHFSFDPIRKMASYSTYQLLFQFVNYFSRNLDKLIIGHWISITALGYYDKSYRLMQMPQNNLGSILNTVLQPNFSQYQDDKVTMSDKYLRVVSSIAAISFPLGITLCLCGPELIILLYGAKWEAAIPCFQILALSIPLTMINSTTGAIYRASNATKYLFYVGVVNSGLMIIAFIIASYWGGNIESIALAWTLLNIWAFCFTFTIMYRIVFKSQVRRVIRVIVKPFINSIILWGVLGAISYFCNYPLFAMAVIKLLLAFIVTLVFMQISGELDVLSRIKSKRLYGY